MRLAWHEFACDLPEDWEVTRYSIAAPAGRFEFANRDGSQGRLSWEHSKRPPDEERILAEYHRRYLLQHDKSAFAGFSGIKTAKVGVFRVGYRHEGEPCQAVAYLKDADMVLMWVFSDYSAKRMECLWQPILESFEPNSGPWREWACFGIRCRLPRNFEIERAACLPADAWIEFQHKNMHRVDVHRWGLPRELLRGRDLAAFAADVLRGSGARVLESQGETWREMDSVRFVTETRGTRGMDRLFASHWRGQARFWHDTVEKRLYGWVQAGPKKITLLAESEVFPE